MIAGLKPYPAYKPSSDEWLGEVPEHWEGRQLKNWLKVNQVVLPENTNPEYTFDYIDIGSVGTGRLVANPERIQFHSSPSRARRVVRSGDTIISMVRTYLKAVWHAEKTHPDLIASTGFAVLTPQSGTCPKFVSFLCQSQSFTHRVTAESVGVAYPAIAETRLETFHVSVPSLPEQTAIARFLDYVDRRIRRYIRAKRKLIALLEEQKQAIIHQAVTGRSDVRTGKPYPAYKPSGVEWLGEVPEHWEKPIKIKYVSSLKGRLGWQGLKASEYTREGPYIVSSAHFHDHKINWAICPHVTQERYEMDEHIQLAQGDILLMKDGAAMGKLAFVDELPSLACLNSHLLLFRPLENDGGETYFPQFMFYYMQTECFQGYVQVNGTGATFLGISQESIGNHKICLPPHSEQVAIVEYLDVATADINTVTSNTKREINLLREYRTRLIADFVTGKLDVREAAAALPEVDPLEAEDEPDDAIDSDTEETAGELDTVLEEAEV